MTASPPTKHFLPTLRRSAADVFAPVQREFNRVFEELGSGWNVVADFDHIPRMDVTETKDAVEITIEMPGVAQADIKLDVEDDILTVSGEKKSEKDVREETYRLSERTYGAFSRSISLPRSVQVDKIKATMADGVLKILAPKDGAVVAKSIKIETPG